MRDFSLPGRSVAVARHGMAATSHPAATLTALRVLEDGGNAVDAALAAVALQSVVEAGSTGIGGDCFALVSLGGSAALRGYNGSGRAPAGLSLDRLRASGIATLGRSSPHAVTVPGAVEAWCRLAREFGRLSLAEILAPAIAAAREGYAITPRVAWDLAHEAALLAEDPTARATFLVDGAAPAVGDVQRQPLLADTLAAIAADGPDAFYRGAAAADMVARLQELGGFHGLDDFAGARGEWVDPITTRFRGRTVHEIPPNGQGVVALLLLAVLDRFPPARDDDPARMRLLVAATRAAYAARDALLADPAFAGDAAKTLLDPAFVADLAARLDPARAEPPVPVDPVGEHRDTVTLSVVDRDRNAVSLINSVFWAYGSGRMAPKSGVLFHNRGLGFSLEPGHPNALAPGKRPMHTIIPGMVSQDGRVVLSFGVMGGQYQAMGHAHFLSRLFDDGVDPQTAADLPRFFPLPGTGEVEAEAPIRDRLTEALGPTGLTVVPAARPIGGAQAIAIDWDRGVLFGASDHRKDGMAAGY